MKTKNANDNFISSTCGCSNLSLSIDVAMSQTQTVQSTDPVAQIGRMPQKSTDSTESWWPTTQINNECVAVAVQLNGLLAF